VKHHRNSSNNNKNDPTDSIPLNQSKVMELISPPAEQYDENFIPLNKSSFIDVATPGSKRSIKTSTPKSLTSPAQEKINNETELEVEHISEIQIDHRNRSTIAHRRWAKVRAYFGFIFYLVKKGKRTQDTKTLINFVPENLLVEQMKLTPSHCTCFDCEELRTALWDLQPSRNNFSTYPVQLGRLRRDYRFLKPNQPTYEDEPPSERDSKMRMSKVSSQ